MKRFDLYIFRLMVVLCLVCVLIFDDKTDRTMVTIGVWLFYIADAMHTKQFEIEKKIDSLNKD